MLMEQDLEEYLGEIREQVCSRCPERPPGGPPCAPLGKDCGVEMHLRPLIESIHAVRSPLIDPYLARNRAEICTHCAFLHSSICPCPMDYLAVLIVDAVERVDERRGRREKGRQCLAGLPAGHQAGIPEVCRAYEEGAGAWVGCDWPTTFGATGLDLNGWTADDAEAMAEGALATEAAKDWAAAADWLARVEQCAGQAEAQAAAAVKAAGAGQWDDAVDHAHRAWALEFFTGRPLRKGESTWRDLRLTVENLYLARRQAPPAGATPDRARPEGFLSPGNGQRLESPPPAG
jgi:hypothetical protein